MFMNEDRTVGENVPSQGYEADRLMDWAKEQIRWSQDQHEKQWCTDHYVYYQHFHNFVNDRLDPDDYHSKIGVGLAFPIVKIISATLTAPWQAGDQIISANPLDEAGQQRAPLVEAYINNVICNRVPRMFSKCELVKESAIAFGRGILKPVVRWDPPMSLLKRVMVELGQTLGLNMRLPTSELTYQHVPADKRFDFDYVDPFNFWWVGSTRWFDECDFSVERGYVTTSDAIRRQMSGEWNADVQMDPGSALGFDEYTRRRAQLQADYTGDNIQARDAGEPPKHHRIHEIQGWCEWKETKASTPELRQMHLVLMDEKVLVVQRRLDTWNGRPCHLVFEPMHDPAGDRPQGVIEPMEQIILVMNDFLNIALDNARKVIESPLMVDWTQTKQTDILLGPAEINWIRNPTQAVAPLPMADLPRSFYQLIDFFNDLIQRISGVSDYFGGMNTSDTTRLTKTARGMELMTNLATKRFAPLLTKMDREFYRPMATTIHETAKQRMKKKEPMRLPANPSSPFVRIGPNDMDTLLEFSFNVKALDAASGRRRGDFIEMMSMINQLAMTPLFMQQGNMLDTYEVARMLMEEFDMEAATSKLIKKLPQMPQAPGGMSPFPTPGKEGIPGTPVVPRAA